jgi:hypothetical protein
MRAVSIVLAMMGVAAEPGALIAHGVDCTLISNGGLPTYAAHPGH